MVDSVLLEERPAQRSMAAPRLVDIDAPAPVTRPSNAFLRCREDFSIVYVSDLLQVMLQLQEQRPGGKRRDVFSLLGSSGVLDAASVEAVLGPLRESGMYSATFQVKTEAAEHTLDVRLKPDGEGRWMFAFEDIRADQERRTEVLALTLTDPLVGTNNRRCYQQTVKSSLADNIPGTAMMLDLDRFRAVNDTYGHAAGDQLLRKVGERLRNIVGRSALLARLGGDEFAVWSYSVDSESMEATAARIVELLDRPFLLDGEEIHMGASVGVAYATEDGTPYERLMKHADLALRAAKHAGRGCFRSFEPEMAVEAQGRYAFDLALQDALEQRQLVVYYRPRFNTCGVLASVEAALRWRLPEQGLLQARDFMPQAERLGLGAAFGNWMLKTAAAETSALPAQVRVSMCLSAAQLAGREPLVQALQQALDGPGVSPRRVELNITEDALLHREEHVLATLHQLRAMGVRVGIEEFGAGDASLRRLLSFPFDHVLFAPSIAACESDEGRAMRRAVASLSRCLTSAAGPDCGCAEIDASPHFRTGEALTASELSRLIDPEGA